MWPALQNSLMQCGRGQVPLCVRVILQGGLTGSDGAYFVRRQEEIGEYIRKIRLALIYGQSDRVSLRGSKRNRPLGDEPPAA